MRSLKCSLSVLVLGAIFSLSSIQVFADQAAPTQDQASQALVRLDVMQKDKKGSLRLKEKAKRYEFITFVNAAMSYDVEADAASVDTTFKDMNGKHAAYNQIKAAVAHGLVSAYKDDTIRPDKIITAGDAITILLKALGYDKEIQGLEQVEMLKMAADLGITGTEAIKYDDPLTRGNAAVYICNFMSIDFSGVENAI